MNEPDHVTWVEAGRHHTQALNQFVCTLPSSASNDPHRGRHHPRRWELDVLCIWTRIHAKNEPSKRVFGAAGFESLGLVDSPTLETWVRV